MSALLGFSSVGGAVPMSHDGTDLGLFGVTGPHRDSPEDTGGPMGPANC